MLCVITGPFFSSCFYPLARVFRLQYQIWYQNTIKLLLNIIRRFRTIWFVYKQSPLSYAYLLRKIGTITFLSCSVMHLLDFFNEKNLTSRLGRSLLFLVDHFAVHVMKLNSFSLSKLKLTSFLESCIRVLFRVCDYTGSAGMARLSTVAGTLHLTARRQSMNWRAAAARLPIASILCRSPPVVFC